MVRYRINDAGLAVLPDNSHYGDCWVCGEFPALCDGLCTDCTGFVLYDGETDRLDKWDAAAAMRGLPPIDRDKWTRFYE